VCMIGTLIFLKVVKKSQAYIQITGSHDVDICCIKELIFGKQAN
jgi:hypothetical protein